MTTDRRKFLTGLGFAVVGAVTPLPPLLNSASAAKELAPTTGLTTLSFDAWLELLGVEFMEFMDVHAGDNIDLALLHRVQTHIHRYVQECNIVFDFQVRCSDRNNPPASLDENRVVCELLVHVPDKQRPVHIRMELNSKGGTFNRL